MYEIIHDIASEKPTIEDEVIDIVIEMYQLVGCEIEDSEENGS